MSTLKKTLAIFLTVCMLAGMLPVGTAFAANDVPAEGAMPLGDATMGGPEIGDIPSGIAGHIHSWNKETGKCDGCGEECKHETTNPIAGKAATCEEQGLSEGKVCATCGKIIAAQTQTPVAAHTFGADGKCTVCGKQKPATEGADGQNPADTNPGGKNTITAANATAGAGGADSNPCDHLKDVDGAEISAFKNGTCEVCGFTCTAHTWNSGGVCTVCGTECEHTWNELSDGSTYKQCSKCNTICNHLGGFEHDGLCRECGYQCEHQNGWVANSLQENTMKCSICGAVCGHKKTGTDGTETSTMEGGVCTVCGFICASHQWTTAADKSVCSICGAACTHPAASAEAADPIPASCTERGREAGTKCGVCGAYTAGGAETEALGHKWNYTDPNQATCDNGCGATCSHVEADGITKAFNADTGVCRICEYPCAHTFNGDVCEICGYVCKHEKMTEGTCDDCKQSFEATITGSDGTIEYCSALSEAISSVADGDTIKLLKPSDVENALTFHANNCVLDLNGFTLARSKNNDGSGDCAIVLNGGSLTIKNGTVTANGKGDAGVIFAQGGASLTIENGVTVDGKANHAVVVADNGTKAYISGTLQSDDQAAITGNATQGGTTIGILKNAVLTSTNGTAIYHPQNGTLNIEGGTITGGQTGVEVRAGTVNISGGTVTGNGSAVECKPNESGLTTKGAGLAVVQHTTGNTINVSISGGTIIGKRAIHEQNPEGNPPSALQEVIINVTGGELKGEVYSKDNKITFSGGAAKDGFTATVQATGGAVTVDNGFINAGATNTIDVKSSDGTPVTDVTLPTEAILESDSSGDTTITIKTDVAEVTLDNAAIAAIKDVVAPNDVAAVASVTLHVADVSQTKQEKTFEVYIQGADGNKIGSNGADSFGGNVQVVLKGIETKPAQVRHYDANNSFLELPDFKYDPANKTVTVTIKHFSFLTLSQKAIPVIKTTAAQLPNAQAGKGYYTKIEATGEPAPTFAVDTTLLPKGLALDTKTGEIKGTVDPGARTGDYSFKITASNSEGTAEMTYRLTVDKFVAAKLYDTDGKTELGSYGTVQEAINAAQDDQTVALVEDSTDNVSVEGKNIYITGDNNIRRKLGNITVKQKDGKGVAGITYISSDKLTVFEGAGAALGDRCTIKTVENKNPYDEVTKTAYVYIVGGNYGQLLPAKGGSYQVTGGTFETAIPMEYCRALDENGNFVKQYYARKNSVSSLYDIAPFTFEITKVSNSGYHMPGSQKTLVFSTNLDYTLADRDRASSSITITSGNSSKAISSVYYDISEGKDGKAEITLKASTLNALSLGRYRLQYKGPTGTDYMYFHISNTVKTGDTSNIGLWLGIMGGSVVVLCAVAAVLVVKSKKKNGGAKSKDIKK